MKCMTCKLTISEMYPIKAAIHEVRRFDGKSVDSAEEKKYYKACFYGCIGNGKSKRFNSRLHKPDEDVLKELLNEVEETNKLVCRKRPASDLTDGEASTSAFPIKVVKME
ncbi:Spindle assembly abnormal protein 6-like protein [Frankliniella fusca]|uniref:Spindle assembly abnormal protein 6-like protein n=1 Tax=Frankliniella fusca TaxID=407009 RepID=A0AAE1HKC2_9NEOP|nr:Spindle assembly abnormal protein 6-like protein [Frankliniella fusca]